MGQGFQFFDIIFFALVAGFIVLRLRRVLGTKTGHEKRPEDAVQRPGQRSGQRPGMRPGERQDGAGDNVVQLPGHDRPMPMRDRNGAEIAPVGPELAQAMADIQLADQNFDPYGFVDGAMQAYEMIISAFAKGDTAVLRPLVNDEVFDNFTAAIDARADENQTMETELIQMSNAQITDAELRDENAEITVKFVAELVSCVKNVDGAIIQGHPTVPQEVSELWTFARDTTNDNPNWTLVGTEPAE